MNLLLGPQTFVDANRLQTSNLFGKFVASAIVVAASVSLRRFTEHSSEKTKCGKLLVGRIVYSAKIAAILVPLQRFAAHFLVENTAF